MGERCKEDLVPIECPTKVMLVDIKGKGRGVVATQLIKKGEVIEICPTIVLSNLESEFIRTRSNKLKFYALELLKENVHVLHLGYGMLYNHSPEPNAEIEYDGSDFVVFRSLKDVNPGEEVVYDYGFDEQEEFLQLESEKLGFIKGRQ